MNNTQPETLVSVQVSKLNLTAKLDQIEEMLNAISITLDDLRGDVIDMNNDFSTELDGVGSGLRDLKSELESVQEDLEDKISSCEDEINSVACAASDAYEMAETLQTSVSEMEDKYNKLDSEVADVLLLKG